MKQQMSILLLVLLAACSSKQQPGTARQQRQVQNDSIVLTPKQLEGVNVNFVQPETRALKPVIYANGVVSLLPDSRAQVSSHIQGKVEQIFVREGVAVRKGQPLLTLSSFSLLELQNEYAAAHSDVEFLTTEYNRQSELRKSNIGVLADYQSVKAKLMAARARETALAAKLQLLGIRATGLIDEGRARLQTTITITAPIDGFVLKFYENIGSIVQPETLLAEIVNPNRVQAKVYVYEKDAALVDEGQEVFIDFVQQHIPSTRGKVLYVSRALDEKNRSITLHVQFERPQTTEMILSDMNIKARLEANGSVPVTNTLPRTALYDDGDKKYIFVTTNARQPQVRMRRYRVEVEQSDDQYVQVRTLEQLPPGQVWVANNNVLAIESERKKNE